MTTTAYHPELGYPATVPGLLRHAVDCWGEADLVVTDCGRMSYREAEVASRGLAARLLREGCGKGTRVATQFPYGIEWIVTWLAVTRIGALHMPMSTAYKPAELRKSLLHGDAHLLISPARMFGEDREEFLETAVPSLAEAGDPDLRIDSLPYLRRIWLLGEPVTRRWASSLVLDELGRESPDGADMVAAVEGQVTPADLSVTIFTSGTTSEPKAVNHSHGGLVRKGEHLARLLEWGPEDRVFCGMPFFWVGGVAMTVVPAMAVGATLLCVDRTDPLRSLDLMERERATRMTGWPGVRGPIEAHPTRPGRDIPALEQPPTGFGRQGSLGMSESLASYTYPDWTREVPEDRTGCMGVPIDGCEIRIGDPETMEPLEEGREGAILIRGYFLMQGLYKREREEVFTPDGFYNTGDKGYLLDGMLYFNGRLTEMIKTSGNNVAPPEVEGVLRSLPEIKDAHVLGVPDSERGEVVAALVVPAPGAVIDPTEVREKARADLSNYKVPRYIVVVGEDQLPWLPTGKPDRLAIREMLIAARP